MLRGANDIVAAHSVVPILVTVPRRDRLVGRSLCSSDAAFGDLEEVPAGPAREVAKVGETG